MEVPADTIVKYIEIEKLKNDTICQENDYSIACAWIEGDYLGLDLKQKEQNLTFELDNSVRETKENQVEVRTVIKEKIRNVKYIPKFYRFTLYFFLVFGSILIFKLLTKIPSVNGLWKKLLSNTGR